jgi:DNA repair protein RadA/Sms
MSADMLTAADREAIAGMNAAFAERAEAFSSRRGGTNLPAADPTKDEGPRVYTIAEARSRSKERIGYLPMLGADGYIVEGWSHLLAGWWRLGKSELMAAAALPWLRSGMRVVWVTEEPDSIWADRADTCDEIYAAVPWDNLILVDAMSATPMELLDKVASIESDVVIIDTIREVCGIGAMKNDDEIRSAVSPWVRRLRGRTLIFIAQHRKSAGERGERVEGSVALPSMMDVVLELEAVDGHDRQRRLTVRRRRAQTAPLTVEMDEDDRIVVVPDARSRSRVETEAAVLFAVNAADGPLTTAEIRSGMTPKPSRDTVHRALIALAEAGTILRDPPIAEAARRRTVKWQSASAAQLDLPQNSIPPWVEFGAEDDVAEDGGVSGAARETS